MPPLRVDDLLLALLDPGGLGLRAGDPVGLALGDQPVVGLLVDLAARLDVHVRGALLGRCLLGRRIGRRRDSWPPPRGTVAGTGLGFGARAFSLRT
jgi:hypothetical protein